MSRVENDWIDYVDRLASAEGGDLVEDIRELDFILLAGNVPDMGRASLLSGKVLCKDRQVHRYQWDRGGSAEKSI